MKVIKINAMWCSACLIMNNIWDKVNKKYNFETITLDYDFDSEIVEKYEPKDIIPIFIFEENNKEVFRIVGEHKEKEMIELIEKSGVLNEKNN